jgi:penicillin-binding protein 1A
MAVGQEPPNKRIRRGAVIRVMQEGKDWQVAQMPEIESAFVAASTTDGAIKAMVGGFDYNRNKFNHVTQAWRQPGSSFKPFIYSASLERGLSPATIINDAPISFDAGQTGGQAWEPKNYDGKYEGPMTMRKGLTKSKNMISIRILHRIGAKYGQEYATRFGFDADKNPPYLTLALGAGNVTPLQMAGAYAVFANGGYKVSPYLISKVTDADGKILSQAHPDVAGDEKNRVIDERNAFLMDSMLKDVVRFGTAAKACAGPPRPRRQDRHHQRFDRCLVRRLPGQAGGHCLDRLRPAEEPGQPRNRRRPGAADLDRLHAEGAEEYPDRGTRGAGRRDAGGR